MSSLLPPLLFWLWPLVAIAATVWAAVFAGRAHRQLRIVQLEDRRRAAERERWEQHVAKVVHRLNRRIRAKASGGAE